MDALPFRDPNDPAIEANRLSQLLLFAIMIAVLTTILTTAMMLYLGHLATAGWIALTLPLYGLVTIVFYITKSTRLAAHGFILLICTLLMIDYGPDGGYAVMATCAIPLAASAMLGTRAGIVWTIIGVVWAGYLGPIVFRPTDFSQALGLGSAIMTLVVGTASVIVESTRARAVKEARKYRRDFEAHQERIRTFAESTFPGITVTSEKGIEYSSPGVKVLLGYTADEFSQQLIVDYVHPDDLPGLYEKVLAVPPKGFRAEIRLRHKQGHWVWLEAFGIPQAGDPDEDLWIFAARDIQEERRGREQLMQSHRLEGIGFLAAGVAHDFNNLLSVIIGRAELMPRSEHSESILLAATQASELTSSLMSFGRKTATPATTIDVVKVIRRVKPMLESLLRPNVEFMLDCPDEPVNAHFADGQLDQILLNLVTNAKEAMPNGGKLSLLIELAATTEPQLLSRGVPAAGYVLLKLIDTGPGMSDETLQHAFDPYYSTKPLHTGSGLGLASVYGIVRDGGGAIELESSLGKGTIARLYLPRAITPMQQPKQSNPNFTGQFFGQRCILVEDDSSVRDALEIGLESLGFDVEVASQGTQALEMAEQRQPDVVVTDIVMPGIRGTELTTLLHQKYPNLPVVLVSGFADPEVEAWVAGHPMASFLAKPFRAADLGRGINELLTRKAQLDLIS
ncbi:MAG: response regulator [Gammaproteobacteria bacterium]|nr:response regulator [Gammaproteobacteria bacterium]